MNLKSLEGILQGVGKLRAASIVAWGVNAAAMLSLNVPASVQGAAITGATVLLAAIHVADGFVRGKHVSALPALIEQGAESVAKVQDPRVDDVAASVATVAARLSALEARPAAPSVAEIISGLVGTVPKVVEVTAAPAASTEPASVPVVEPVSTPVPATPGA